MDGKGRFADNITIERFWRSLKHEHCHYHAYEDLPSARTSVGSYIELYNRNRLHESLGYKTPQEVYKGGVTKSVPSRSDGEVDNLVCPKGLPKLPTSPQTQQQPLPMRNQGESLA